MINAIAIDDESPALAVIEKFCNDHPRINQIKTFESTSEATKYLENFPVDVIFLDINMPAISGIDFYKSLHKKHKVIFTTAYSNFAVEGFNLNAVDYLLKPISYERFCQAIDKLLDTIHQVKTDQQEYLYIRADYALHKISYVDITHIEGYDDYVKIHQSNEKVIVARMTLKTLFEKIQKHSFVRIHRSFIVNKNKITKVKNKSVFLGEIEIPISSSYEQELAKNGI